ncbi:MAG: ATP phosphoribosyltransferase, partial [Thaumarchaeota archaeon]|nr:ATP phosphoribosyltransferase [Nitrososphaerota archaeon]
MTKIKFAIPKGSLEKATYEIIENAGYKIYGKDRTYRPKLNDPAIEVKILRPQEIPVIVSEGMADIGITGQDWILETNANVETLMNLEYGKIKIVLAVSKDTKANSLSELIEEFAKKGKTLRFSTEYLNLVSKYIMKNKSYRKRFGNKSPVMITPWWRKGDNPKVSLYLSFGATEAKPPEDADAIFDVIETGSTLDQNNLKAIETVMESFSVLIANKKAAANKAKREKIFDVLTLLKGVVDGRKKIHIFLNVKKENLQKLLKSLPSLKGPTISELSTKGWYSINTIVGKDEFLKLLPSIRRLSQGLVVHNPQQILSLEEIWKNES